MFVTYVALAVTHALLCRMDQAEPHQTTLERLDGVPVPGAWVGRVAQALHHLWESASSEDRAILAPLDAFLSEHAFELAIARAVGSTGALTVGARDIHPVASTLLLVQPRTQFPGLTRLLLVLVTAGIEAGMSAPDAQRNQIARLAAIARGALEDRDSPLRLLLCDAPSLPKMVMGVDAQLQQGGEKLHKTFAVAWQSWLRGLLIRWIQQDPLRLSAALRPAALLPDPDSADQELGGGPDIDDQSVVRSDQTEPVTTTTPDIPAVFRKYKAIANGFLI